jgi:hypothetical protein
MKIAEGSLLGLASKPRANGIEALYQDKNR